MSDSDKQELNSELQEQLAYMNEEQRYNILECCRILTGNINITEALLNYNYDNFTELGILDLEECQILDIMYQTLDGYT